MPLGAAVGHTEAGHDHQEEEDHQNDDCEHVAGKKVKLKHTHFGELALGGRLEL